MTSTSESGRKARRNIGIGGLTIGDGPPARPRSPRELLGAVAEDTAIVGFVLLLTNAIVRTSSGSPRSLSAFAGNLLDPWLAALLGALAAFNLFLRLVRPHLADQLVQASLYNGVTMLMALSRHGAAPSASAPR